MEIAIFGLGRMGMQIARRLHKNGFTVLAWNRSDAPRRELDKYFKETFQLAGSQTFAGEPEVFAAASARPGIFWLMLPNSAVEDFLLGPGGIERHLRPGDIVIDGGNSFYKDSVRRAEALGRQGVHFFDAGVSGGVWGEQNGFALMVGGPKEQWGKIEPIFKVLSSGENYGLVGKSGAGHFVKMVHNGIEYGMMEAIAEGFAVLQAGRFNLNLAQVSKIYQKGSVVSSWLIDLTRRIFEREDPNQVSGKIDFTGEGEWTVSAAEELGVDARVIADALAVRRESQEPKNQNKFSNKLVALMRKQFGGHEVTPKE